MRFFFSLQSDRETIGNKTIDHIRRTGGVRGNWMLIVRRVAVWLIETLGAAILLGVLLRGLWGTYTGPGEHTIVTDVLRYAALTIVVFMVGSGYVVTTAICGAFWRSRKWWLYPSLAAMLFAVHLQFGASGWEASQKIPIQVIGACIAFGCATVGGWFLHRR